MSIRFYLSEQQKLESKDWLLTNIPKNEYRLVTICYPYILDIMCEDDAIVFSIKFGIKKDSTKLERMIAREKIFEQLESMGTRTQKSGLGPWPK